MKNALMNSEKLNVIWNYTHPEDFLELLSIQDKNGQKPSDIAAQDKRSDLLDEIQNFYDSTVFSHNIY